MKHSYEILRKATADLKVVIERKFDEAREKDDESTMHQCLRYFPMINDHSVGLQLFGQYLNTKIEKFGDEYYRVGL